MTLEDTIEEYWPVNGVEIECDECGEVLHTTTRDELTIDTPSYLAKLIDRLAWRHYRHYDHVPHLNISITSTVVVKDIATIITVDTNEDTDSDNEPSEAA